MNIPSRVIVISAGTTGFTATVLVEMAKLGFSVVGEGTGSVDSPIVGDVALTRITENAPQLASLEPYLKDRNRVNMADIRQAAGRHQHRATQQLKQAKSRRR